MSAETTKRRPEFIQRLVRDRAHFLGFLRFLSRDPELAEELFQELSVAVIENIDSFDPARDFGAWVRGIARNLYRAAVQKNHRRLKGQVAYDPTLVDAVLAAYEGRSAQEEESHADHLQRLRRCLDQLPERHRKLIADRYQDNLPSGRIAELYGRTVSAVETALCRLRAALLDCVRKEAGVES